MNITEARAKQRKRHLKSVQNKHDKCLDFLIKPNDGVHKTVDINGTHSGCGKSVKSVKKASPVTFLCLLRLLVHFFY